MSTFARLALIPVLTLAVVACGDGDGDGTDTTAATTTVLDASAPAVSTTAVTATTALPAPEPTTATTVLDGPVQIDVVVGVDSGPDRVEQVRVGSDVTLNITNPDAADEFHLHGIEMEQAVDAGVMATFNFVADTAGTYEVESHETDGVLVVIVVS